MHGIDIIQASVASSATDFSLFSLFLQAHIVVKFVIFFLISASVWSWTIIIEKEALLRRTSRLMNEFEEGFWAGRSLEEFYRSLIHKPSYGMCALFIAAMREWNRSSEISGVASPGLQWRIEKVLNVTISRELRRLEKRLLFLATIGSTAPFIGLFGTVWGVMNSFQAIALSKSTNLAVVAPGIAEALFATALGLLAAIPAVVFYNKFLNQISYLTMRLEGFADEFSAILSRHIDGHG